MVIAQKFEQLRAQGEKALVAFVTAGDPSLDELPAILACLEEGGADLIEVGIPFSDPIADGPTIQASSQRSLERGTTPTAVLEKLSAASVGVPIVAMGYVNPIHRMGYSAFAGRAAAAGIAGTIVSDLIPEEAGEWIAASRAAGLDTIFLVAPTSTEPRIEMACRECTGFLYAVSRTGVTGRPTDFSVDLPDFVARLRACTQLPICVGFGIRNPEGVREVCRHADGAVVGSFLVDRLAAEWEGGKGASAIRQAVAQLKAATRS